MQVTAIEPIPANANPFNHDLYNMGTSLGSNVMVMHENHNDAPADYLIIVHIPTGHRVRIEFPEMKDRKAMRPEVMEAICQQRG